ncbi:patatin-like phospholipase family protein [Crenobacter sp. SG2303]|uniref:Patatin-like phospholipase family protein n=1 Tax=Crenobacter oryzisoli TaxID=3056844 RepID=A0ABT7XTE0_9NEIS|nr:patatin-like phospholipase family protein [Crenobacter sp. SG2303]MDN0076320.1 patatin-like phospholipase family protein [Crenobacter sp. SG2303]MDN0076809.1 patatin-like phospholipase family protein [Crenobacter sp. SG2303]
MQAKPSPAIRRINIALQGGGSHGAFSWGVLDRLLEDGRIEVDGICGTSAGAINATVLAYGLASGGGEGARRALETLWRQISDAARLSPLQPSWLDRMMGCGNMDLSPAWLMFDHLTRFFSPYQLNPCNLNPLRDVLLAVVDFEVLQNCRSVKLFLCATNVLSGRIRVFTTSEICVQAVLASSCLPFLFQAVEIDNEYYWDGGYMGNPPIYPLIYDTDSSDVLIIRINPIRIPEVPTTARQILDRINTLSFNSSLMREMRAVDFITRLIDKGALDPASYRRMLIHSIDAEAEMAQLGVSSKFNADWGFLREVFALGRERADAWLTANFDALGQRSSIDIADTFL